MAAQPIDMPDDDFVPDVEQFVSFLREEEVKSQDQFLDDERANAIDFYNGEPFGDEEEGRSQVVTRDVAEVVDYMTVSLLRTMVSGDKVVEFDYPQAAPPQQATAAGPDGQPIPPQPKAPSIAEQATAAVSHEFYQGQDGYRFLHDWIKAGLLEKTSTAKVCIEEQKPKRVEAEISIDDLTQLQEQGANIVGLEQIGPETFRCAILQPQPPKFRDYVSPNEETMIAQDARDMDDDCVYSGYKMAKTLSELAEMGFETDDISDDGQGSGVALSLARDAGREDYTLAGFSRRGANRKVWYFEEYSRYDLNEDGIAELVMSHRVGNHILIRKDTGALAVEEIDDQPGVTWCPFPMPHRIVGQSLADKTMDIQRTRSVAFRQTLDGFYFANNPMTFLHESSIGDTTIEDLLTVRPGRIARWTGAVKPEIQTPAFDPSSGITLMEVLSGEKEQRTGITRLNQGLDEDTLNKTASGQAALQAQGQQIEEYLARNFAEALARLYRKKYNLMRKFGRPMVLMIDGQQVEVDPRQWPEDMNVVVRVGLGSGRKDQRLQYRQMLLEIAQQAIMGGSRVFNDDNLYNNIKGLIADANLGNVRELATDPSMLPPANEKPDPAAQKAQADALIATEKLKQDQARQQQDAALARQQMQTDAQMKQQQLDYDLTAKREKAALDESLARDKATFEANLATQQADREWQLSLMQLAQNKELATMKHEQDAEMAKKRPGGRLDV
jgi:hypothetical protein